MIGLETIAVAFSMFSAIPMPQFDWNPRNMRYALCAFPLVGAVIGGLLAVWVLAAGWLGLPRILLGAGLCLIPVLVTGGIHLDGYADTQDARNSHQTPERRQEILRDPHLGAFAAIRLCGYFILSFALWCALPEVPLPAAVLMLCLSRSLSGLAVASFPLAKDTGLAHTFATSADKQTVCRILTLLSVLLLTGLCLQGVHGLIMAAAAMIVFVYYRHMAVREFGGLSGDLAGWFLQTAEIWMLGAMCLGLYLEAML